MMWFFRHFWIFISYHIFLLNQAEGAIAIPPSNSAPLPLFCPSVCPSVCLSIGLLTTFSGFCTFADKSLGRNGIELEMQIFPDDLPLANIDADGYCCHFMRSSVRPTIHGLGFVYCIQSAWKKWPTIWHADVSRWLTRARHLFLPQLGSRTTIKQYRLVRNRNLLGHDDNIFCCYEKIQISGRNLIISLFLFQDSLEVVLSIFVHFDITGTRNTFKGYKNVWKLKISIQNFERIRIYSPYTQHLSTCHVMSPLYVYRKVSCQHISNEVR